MLGKVFWAREYFCATARHMIEELIQEYLEHHFEPNSNDNFRMGRARLDTSFSRRESVLLVHNPNPPALTGGCLVLKIGYLRRINRRL